jgi:KDO2-lipid IV(A) lauroyltransferase
LEEPEILRSKRGQFIFSKALNLLGYLLYEMGGMLARVVPVPVSYSVAVMLADLNFLLNRRSRTAVFLNLRHVLGDSVSEEELRKTAKRTFRNFGRFIVDFLRFPGISAKSIISTVDLDMVRVVKEELRRGKGVILLGAHVGNWELGGANLSLSGFPLSVVAMPHTNELIDRFFVRRRTRKGVGVVSRSHATSELLGSLRRGECIAILGDRNVLGPGMQTKFFDSPAPMPYGHVILSLRTGAPIVPGFVVRERGTRFKFYVEEPIRPGSCRDAFEDLMHRCITVMETYVRRYPDQWFVFEPIWRKAE